MTRAAIVLGGLLLALCATATTTLATCENHGYIVSVGTYQCQGPCTNFGVVAWVGDNCYGDGGGLGACYRTTCAPGLAAP